MRNRIKKYLNIIILAAVFIALVMGSCKNNADKSRKKLIPEKTLISILKDSYIADGLLINPEIHKKYYARDSVTNYIKIIESYGYSKSAMDNTIKYYINNKPKKLINIYDKVQVILSELETQLESDPLIESESVPNPFNINQSYILPDPEGSEKPGFNITLPPSSNYTMNFTITVYVNDKSVNPCFTAYLCNADSSKSQNPEFLPSIKYSKDGLPHSFAVTGKTGKNDFLVLKGWFYDFENRPDLQCQHALIENISFSITRE